MEIQERFQISGYTLEGYLMLKSQFWLQPYGLKLILIIDLYTYEIFLQYLIPPKKIYNLFFYF
jgi:hypothetical protein